MLLPGVASRNDFTSAVVIHVALWKNMVCQVQLVLVIGHFTQATRLSPQGMNCLML